MLKLRIHFFQKQFLNLCYHLKDCAFFLMGVSFDIIGPGFSVSQEWVPTFSIGWKEKPVIFTLPLIPILIHFSQEPHFLDYVYVECNASCIQLGRNTFPSTPSDIFGSGLVDQIQYNFFHLYESPWFRVCRHSSIIVCPQEPICGRPGGQ